MESLVLTTKWHIWIDWYINPYRLCLNYQEEGEFVSVTLYNNTMDLKIINLEFDKTIFEFISS